MSTPGPVPALVPTTPETSLPAEFAAVVARRGPHVAVRDEETRLTYDELAATSAALAETLRDLAVCPGELVGLLIDRSVWTPVAVLGILRAGAAYVPLDPAYPSARLADMARDCALRLVVDATGTATAAPVPDVTVVDARQADDRARSAGPVPEVPGGAAPAYVIYTSGSTGRPKGCVVSHDNVLALMRAALPLFDVGPADRWTLFHSFSFDFSVWELWGALLSGGTAVCVAAERARSPEDLLDQIVRDGITVLNQVPSAFRALARFHGALGSPPLPLRYVIFGGERIDPDVVTAFRARCGATAPRLVNMYGITETTVHVTFKVLDEDVSGADGTPIGRPLPHLSVTLRDELLRPVPDGAIGEICVSGAGLASGYLNRPDLTAERFPTVSAPDGGRRLYRSGDLGRVRPDGELEYHGRRDHQVKVRGFRIEPGEVEAALRGHPDVRDVAVIPVPAPGGQGDALLACVVPDREVRARDLWADLRRHARQLLPEHMVPAGFELVTEVPLTSSGKADRRALHAVVSTSRRGPS